MSLPSLSFGGALAAWIRHHSWLTLALGLALALGCAAGARKLQANFTHTAMFHADDPYLLQLEDFQRRFGNDDTVVLALHSPSGIFDEASAALLLEATEALWTIPEVIRVESLSNYRWVHAEGDELIIEPLLPDDQPLSEELLRERRQVALSHELLPGWLLSEDAQTTLLYAHLAPDLENTASFDRYMEPLRALAASLERGDHRLYIAGVPAVNAAMASSSKADFQRLMPLVLLAVMLLTGGALRRLSGVGLTLGVVLLSAAAAYGIAGWAGVELNVVTAVIPQLFVAIGVADALHLLVSFFHALDGGQDRAVAAERTLVDNLRPTLLTSLTTAVGFLAFSFSDVKAVAGFGVVGGLGVMVAWVLCYALLGPALFLLPLAGRARRNGGDERRRALVSSLTSFLTERRALVLAGFGVLTIIATVLALQNRIDSDPVQYFGTEVPIRAATDFVDEELGGARGVELVVDSGQPGGILEPDFLGRVQSLQSWIEAQPRVSRAFSVVDLLRQTHRALHGDRPEAYRLAEDRDTLSQELFLYSLNLPVGMGLEDRVSLDQSALRLSVLWSIPSSRDSLAAIEAIEGQAERLGLDVHATGKNTLYQRQNGYVARSLLGSILAAVLLVGGLLVLSLRSPRLGLLALLPNLIPLLSGAAALRLSGQPMSFGSMLVFALCLGVAVDDSIHVISGVDRARRAGSSAQQAVRRVLERSGPALVITSVVLVVAFGLFGLSSFTPNRTFGLLAAVSLTLALLSSLVLVPAILLRPAGGRVS